MGLLKLFDGQEYKPVGVSVNVSTTNVTLDKVYPIGAVYISTVATDPATLFGFGTWERIKDTFLIAAGDTYAAGTTGGEAEHTLTVDEMPSHNHLTSPFYGSAVTSNKDNYGKLLGANPNAGRISKTLTYEELEEQSIKVTGGSQPHNNMPPYLAVYMWKRTA